MASVLLRCNPFVIYLWLWGIDSRSAPVWSRIYPLLDFDSPLEFLPQATISMPASAVHRICPLEILSWDFCPFSTLSLKEFHACKFRQNLPRTPAGFDHPLGVRHSFGRQILFHTWSAHGVCLTEHYSWLKAANLSDSVTSLQLISRFSINPQRGKSNFRHLALRSLSLSQAVPNRKLLSSVQAYCSHRIITSREYFWIMRPASRPFPLCSYFCAYQKTAARNSALGFWLIKKPHLIFQTDTTLMAFFTSFYPFD